MLTLFLSNSPLECDSDAVYLLNPTNVAEILTKLKYESKVLFKHPMDEQKNTMKLEDRVQQW
eukprot:7677863-Ditylum_brightwellii.AAC.1